MIVVYREADDVLPERKNSFSAAAVWCKGRFLPGKIFDKSLNLQVPCPSLMESSIWFPSEAQEAFLFMEVFTHWRPCLQRSGDFCLLPFLTVLCRRYARFCLMLFCVENSAAAKPHGFAKLCSEFKMNSRMIRTAEVINLLQSLKSKYQTFENIRW